MATCCAHEKPPWARKRARVTALVLAALLVRSEHRSALSPKKKMTQPVLAVFLERPCAVPSSDMLRDQPATILYHLGEPSTCNGISTLAWSAASAGKNLVLRINH